jgi:hypothetical protein
VITGYDQLGREMREEREDEHHFDGATGETD